MKSSDGYLEVVALAPSKSPFTQTSDQLASRLNYDNLTPKSQDR